MNMKKQRESIRNDLVVVVVSFLIFWTAGFYLDLFEVVHDYLHTYEAFQLDELLMAMLFASFAAAWFSWRRWRETRGALSRLRKSETYIHDIVNNMDVGLLVYQLENVDNDRTLRLISANPAASELIRSDISSHVGQTIDEAFPGLRALDLPAKFARVACTGESFTLDDVHYGDERIAPSSFSFKAFALPDQCVGVSFENTSSRTRLEMKRARDRKMTDSINLAQELFIREAPAQEIFSTLLDEYLSITASEYGFIGRILHTDEGVPYLKVFALTNIAWNEETHALYEKYKDSGMEFRNLKSLFGETIRSGEMVIANNPANDPRGCGIPAGHPPLNSFMGLPITIGAQFVGMVGVANRAEGYHEAIKAELEPLISASAQLISAYNIDQQRKQAEDLLKRTMERHEEAQQVAHLGHWELDLISNELSWSDENYRIFGVQPGTVNTYETFLATVHPDDLAHVNDAFRSSVANRTLYDIDHRLLMPDGSVKWVHERCNTYYDDSGTPLRSVGTVHDITHFKLAMLEQEKTALSLRKISKAVEEAGEGVMITNRDAQIEYVNPAFCRTTGYLREEVIGRNPSILKSEAQDPDYYRELWATISSGRIWQGTLIDRRKDGSFYPALTTISPIHDDDGRISHYVSLQQDMTEYKQMEEQFLQAQKMESIGTLVGGIAHDFNNMLAAIQGNLYLAKMRLKRQVPEEALDKIENVERISLSAAEMVKQLLTFARRDSVSMGGLLVGPYIKEAISLSRSATPENISIASYICKEMLHVHGDSTQIQQMVMNLINNARDAVEGVAEPRITVRLDPFIPDEAFRMHYPAATEQMVRLSVADNGCGIGEKNLQKIFEPFFTTKGVGKGTGLGLAMVFGAVKRHDGIIDVESTEGAGTEFIIYLPLVSDVLDVQEGHADELSAGQNELILLVDDEDMLRNTSAELLRNIGYRVIDAADGESALQLFRESSKEISLLITDIVMPRMGGVELAEAARKIREDIPVIFITGYDREQSLADSHGGDKSMLLNKPFEVAYLSQVIRNLIDA
ncbi:PAS domain S-box-containing protein [Mariprofundus ferrinatatus]|uniref:histidine kinase n=1 Tax=Mariprofundus ferrinatatus TaxID=1921087 RepID=A0A2K8L276_9PROT|nr:PAS domain-containing protein [Mariprofundus ferrinatatus]ATX81353.1 PAS domain S-box-containing protein [Mariprofundus ferrinatatus]